MNTSSASGRCRTSRKRSAKISSSVSGTTTSAVARGPRPAARTAAPGSPIACRDLDVDPGAVAPRHERAEVAAADVGRDDEAACRSRGSPGWGPRRRCGDRAQGNVGLGTLAPGGGLTGKRPRKAAMCSDPDELQVGSRTTMSNRRSPSKT